MSPAELARFAEGALDGATRAWTEAEFASLLAADTCVLCAHDDAFAIGRVVADEAELLLIVTARERRRSGQARRCLTAFEAACAARGAKAVFLEVGVSNAAARGLYDSAGYVVAGERPDYYQKPDGRRETALVLRKLLGPADTT